MTWQREEVQDEVYFDNGAGKRMEVVKDSYNQWRVQVYLAPSAFCEEWYTRESREEALKLAEELMKANSDKK